MKVVHINAGGELGGAKTHLLALLPELRKLGVDAEFLCFADGLLPQQAQNLGVPTRTLGINSMVSPRLFVRLYLYLKKTRPCIVHTHGGRANLYGRVAARLTGVPVVMSTVHSHTDLDYTSWWQNVWFSAVDKATWGLADCLVAVSLQLKQALVRRGLAENKTRVITNGIPDVVVAPQRELAIRPGARVICFVGRLVPVKNLSVLLNAIKLVSSSYPEIVLLIMGDGPLGAGLRQQSEELGIKQNVRFMGYRHDVLSIMQATEAFVLSSNMEGLPIVLLEALASKVPVVATAVGGIPEIIDDGRTGLLVPPRNPEQLAAAITQVLSDTNSARQRAELGRAWFEANGTSEVMARKTLAMYLEWEGRKCRS